MELIDGLESIVNDPARRERLERVIELASDFGGIDDTERGYGNDPMEHDGSVSDNPYVPIALQNVYSMMNVDTVIGGSSDHALAFYTEEPTSRFRWLVKRIKGVELSRKLQQCYVISTNNSNENEWGDIEEVEEIS